MSSRRHRRVVIVVTVVLAVGFGIFAAFDAMPSWQVSGSDQISTLPANDQATLAATDRRVARAHATTSVAPPLGLTSATLAGAAALIAVAIALFLPHPRHPFGRIRRFLAWTLRSPPAERALRPAG